MWLVSRGECRSASRVGCARALSGGGDKRYLRCARFRGVHFGQSSLTLTIYLPPRPRAPLPLGRHEFKHTLVLAWSTTLLQFPRKLSPGESKTTRTLTGLRLVNALTSRPHLFNEESNLTCSKAEELSLIQNTLKAEQFYSRVVGATRGTIPVSSAPVESRNMQITVDTSNS